MGKGITENELLDELAEWYRQDVDERQPGDVTTDEVAQKLGIQPEVARRFLAKQVAAGKLKRASIIENKHRYTVYRHA